MFRVVEGARLGMDMRGTQRIKKSFVSGLVNIGEFRIFQSASFDESVNDSAYLEFLNSFLTKRDGILIVIGCLYSRLLYESENKLSHSIGVVEFARKTLASYDFAGSEWEYINHELALLAKTCLGEHPDAARQVCMNFKTAHDGGLLYNEYEKLLQNLATAQPLPFLDVFVGNDPPTEDDYIGNVIDQNVNPLELISESDLQTRSETNRRGIPKLITRISPFSAIANTNRLQWKPLLHKLLEMSPDKEQTLRAMSTHVNVLTWNGSIYQVLEGRLSLLDEFKNSSDPLLLDWARTTEKHVAARIKDELQSENHRRRFQNESFE